MFKEKDNEYISLISETYKVAITLTTKDQNYDENLKYVHEWLNIVKEEIDKANISYEYSKVKNLR